MKAHAAASHNTVIRKQFGEEAEVLGAKLVDGLLVCTAWRPVDFEKALEIYYPSGWHRPRSA